MTNTIEFPSTAALNFTNRCLPINRSCKGILTFIFLLIQISSKAQKWPAGDTLWNHAPKIVVDSGLFGNLLPIERHFSDSLRQIFPADSVVFSHSIYPVLDPVTYHLLPDIWWTYFMDIYVKEQNNNDLSSDRATSIANAYAGSIRNILNSTYWRNLSVSFFEGHSKKIGQYWQFWDSNGKEVLVSHLDQSPGGPYTYPRQF